MPANSLAINTNPLALPPARVTAAAPRKHSGQIKSPLSRQLGPLQGDEPRRGYSVQTEVPFARALTSVLQTAILLLRHHGVQRSQYIGKGTGPLNNSVIQTTNSVLNV